MEAAKRVLLNTGFLYGKMLITIVIALYSTRLILNALGAEDFGIFNIVAGVIGMLHFLNAAMTVSTQRYLSFYIGAKDTKKLKSVFSSSVTLHLLIGVIVVIIFEGAGIFLFDGFLNLPPERVTSAKIVFHFMVVSTFFTINAVPYDAAIVSHENMLFDAIVGVFESVAKLGIAIWLVYTQQDKLILYGILMAGLVILIRIIKSVYCLRKYEECSGVITTRLDKSLIKEMFSFAGWNLFGSFCHVLRNQGLAILLNVFFGVIVNAAYGIANQVNAQLNNFSANLLKALNPQIIKSEGGNERERMLRLAMIACKMSFFLMAFFAIPLMLEMEYVLKLWLKDVPKTTVEFSQLILILSLVTQLTVGLRSAIQSTGRIKIYQVVVGSLLMLNIPMAFILIKIGLPSYSVIGGSVLLEIIAGGLRIMFAKKIAQLDVKTFVREVVVNTLIAVSIATGIAYLPNILLDEGFIRLMLTAIVSSISLIVFMRIFALTPNEKSKISDLISLVLVKFKKHPKLRSL